MDNLHESKFGDRLREIRIEKGLSQQELADILGTSKQVISRYETNQRVPKLTVAIEYAVKLGIPKERLLDNSWVENGKKPAVDDGELSELKRDILKLMDDATDEELADARDYIQWKINTRKNR